MAAIEADHYRENRKALQEDPIIITMTSELLAAPAKVKATWAHASGEPTFEFMQMANREFTRRGGKGNDTIGAVAKALLANLAQIQGKA